jgi:hypothetical protein
MLDLLPLPRLILLRELCPIFAVLSPAFKRIDIAERARVREIKLDNIIAIVERRPWVWPQGRFRVEGYKGARRVLIWMGQRPRHLAERMVQSGGMAREEGEQEAPSRMTQIHVVEGAVSRRPTRALWPDLHASAAVL